MILKPGNPNLALYASLSTLLGVCVYFFGLIIATAIAHSATVYGVSSLHLGGNIGIGEAFSMVKGKIRRVINVSIASGLIEILGFILLIIPGLIFLTWYALAIPACLLENLETGDALKRSKKLSEGGRGRIFTIYFLVWILTVAIGALLGVVESVVFKVQRTNVATFSTSYILQVVSQLIVNTLVYPVGTIAMVLVYYDQRVRKEAFDIDHMMLALGSEAPANAPSTPAY